MLHQLWLWLWFFVGAFLYMLQRSYYGVTSEKKVELTYRRYFLRCWIPLLFRFTVDSGFFWATFTPQLLAGILKAAGYESYGDTIETLSKYAPAALGFGICVDFGVDFSVTKIPILKDIWPQMPPPLTPDELATAKAELAASKSKPPEALKP